MLKDFTEALGRYLVSRMAAMPEKPVASFSLPGAVAGQNALSIFLSAMAEDLDLRSSEPQYERQGLELVALPPPIRLRCTFIVSAWPAANKPPEEAAFAQLQLLGEAYRLMASLKTLPTAVLPEPMKGPGLPKPAIALVEDGLSGKPEFWTSAGCAFRPAFAFAATISLPVTERQYDHLVEEVRVDYDVKL